MGSVSTSHKEIRLLVVDEHSEFCDQVIEHTELCRHRHLITCKVVRTVEDALQQVREWGASVIMLDAFVSGVEGLTLIEECRTRQRGIVVTSDAHSEGLEGTVLSRGADSFFIKDSNPEQIEKILERIIEIAPLIPPLH